MLKRPPVVITSTITAVALGGAWAARATQPLQGAPRAAARAKPRTAALRTIAGPVERMQWGPVQVTLVVRAKHIMDVRATAPMERPRSGFINRLALPMLRLEVLKAQSAHIDDISGATMTSDAYRHSVQGALAKM
jgi:uncharacterized protein with FMN-binding domain